MRERADATCEDGEQEEVAAAVARFLSIDSIDRWC